MPRGRRTAAAEEAIAPAAVEVVEEVPQETPNPDEETSNLEEETNELDDVEVTEEDLAETATTEVEDAVSASEHTEDLSEVAESAIEDSGEIRVTYVGLKRVGKTPGTITVTVPDEEYEPDDTSVVITNGTTFTMKLGKSYEATARQADWLSRHPKFKIEKA